MPSPPKKTKKSLETPAFSPILTDFSVRLLYFCPVYAMFLPCPPLFILPFCSISLFLFVFSLFLRSFWLFFSFLALFFTFYGICALCTRFFGGCFSIGFLSAGERARFSVAQHHKRSTTKVGKQRCRV